MLKLYAITLRLIKSLQFNFISYYFGKSKSATTEFNRDSSEETSNIKLPYIMLILAKMSIDTNKL